MILLLKLTHFANFDYSVWKFPWLRLNIDIDCFDHGLDRYLQDCAISISLSTIRCLTLTFCHKKLSIQLLPLPPMIFIKYSSKLMESVIAQIT